MKYWQGWQALFPAQRTAAGGVHRIRLEYGQDMAKAPLKGSKQTAARIRFINPMQSVNQQQQGQKPCTMYAIRDKCRLETGASVCLEIEMLWRMQ